MRLFLVSETPTINRIFDMIIVQLLGGMGNQMFQYAAGRSLALKHNTELKIDISKFKKIKGITPRQYALSRFRIKETIASEKDLLRVNMPSSILHNFFSKVYCAFTGSLPLSYDKEPHFHFDPDFFTLSDNVYLDGYRQSEKYFKNIEDIIKKEFTLQEKPDIQNKRMEENILKAEAISVHIRRGDYITNPVNFRHHGVCSLEYYHAAIEFIAKNNSNPHFFIFSDDPVWVQKNLLINYPHTFVTHNQGINDPADLRLMSLCKHHIIANSSFSWWGAWLGNYNEKIIIAPKKWVNDTTMDTRDLIPESWHII